MKIIDRIKLQIIIDDKPGGVFQVYSNLIEHCKDKFEFSFLLLHKREDDQDGIAQLLITKSVNYSKLVFSKYENKYNITRRLCELVDPDATLLVNNHLEIEAYCLHRLKNKIVFYVHGSFPLQFEIVRKYYEIFDGIICVSKFIETQIVEIVPDACRQKIVYIKHIVPVIREKLQIRQQSELTLIYIGRFTSSKGSDDLIKIHNYLTKEGVVCKWNFISNGLNVESFKSKIVDLSKSCFYSNIASNEVYDLLRKSHVLVFPSYSEGFPLAVIEAMQCGVVPMVYNIESGIPEIVIDKHTGNVIEKGETVRFVDLIKEYNNDRRKLEEVSERAVKFILDYFSPERERKMFLQFMKNVENNQSSKNFPESPFFLRNGLDKAYFPNLLVKVVRRLKDHYV